MNIVVVEPCDVGVTGEEPEKLAHNTVEVDFLGGDKRECFFHVVS